MIVKILKAISPGISIDGIHIETVERGQQIELPLDLAQALIRDKMAEEYKESGKKEDSKKEEPKKD
jgi:hypothetical protein